MIKEFAEPLNISIPDGLKPYILTVIYANSRKHIDLKYPMYPTGFPIFIDSLESLPIILVEQDIIKPQDQLNIAGQIYDANIYLKYNGVIDTVGLVMHPLAPYYLFHQKGKTLINRWTGLGKDSLVNFSPLYMRLSSSNQPVERAKIILNFLEGLIKNKLQAISWLDKAMGLILENEGNIDLKNLIDEIDVGIRHFRRVFKSVVGVPPKYFCKVIQLHSVFQSIHSGSEERLHLLALDSGYYDQAHFINDFKKMIGSSPNNFLNSKHSFIKSYMGMKV